MSGWIKWEKDLENDPRFRRMTKDFLASREIDPRNATPLQVATHVTLLSGALLRMWAHADTYLREDDTFDMSAQDMDAYLGISEFSAICCRDWFRETEDGRVQLPGFHDKNSPERRERDQTAKRVARHRAKKSNASPLPDQTRPDQKRPDQEHTQSAREPERFQNKSELSDPQVGEFIPATEAEKMGGFARVMTAYPPMPRAFDGMTAERNCQLLIERHGETWRSLENRARAYRMHCESGGISGPDRVTNPEKFFRLPTGTEDIPPWRFDWQPVATKAERRLDANVAAVAEAKRRLFGGTS